MALEDPLPRQYHSHPALDYLTKKAADAGWATVGSLEPPDLDTAKARVIGRSQILTSTIPLVGLRLTCNKSYPTPST